MKLIFSTHNQGKIREAEMILNGPQIEIVSAEEAGVSDEVVEDGDTFLANAEKKAKAAVDSTGLWATADDSGICIEALGGSPGVQSARWAGDDVPGEAIVKKTLDALANVPAEKRHAFMETAVVLMAPDGRKWRFIGKVFGKITHMPKGNIKKGLPYDMIFMPDGYKETFAEMPESKKHSISHRGRAMRELAGFLEMHMPTKFRNVEGDVF